MVVYKNTGNQKDTGFDSAGRGGSMKHRRKIRKNQRHRWIQCCAIPLSFILAYQVLGKTVPYVAESLNAVTVFSAGASFLGGGLSYAKQEIALHSAEANQSPSSSQPESSVSVPPDTSTAESAGQQDSGSGESEALETNASLPPAPEKPEGAGTVTDRLVTAGNTNQFVPLEYGYVKNLSTLSAEQIVSLSQNELSFSLEDTEEPQVLIYHTHATESYQPYDCDWYDPAYNARNQDNAQNMVAVGDVLESQLKAAGIGVIHDTTQHDNPSYTGAYSRSRETIQKYLDEYPSIKVILDVHRDALQGDNVITAPTTEINGVKTAQLMMICCADDGTGNLPNSQNDLTFACQLQKGLESKYPTLTRPILYDDRSYNQDMAPGALLVEVGGHGNTLPEAKNAIRLFGEELIALLKP
jgi:stage II sporulation protein P